VRAALGVLFSLCPALVGQEGEELQLLRHPHSVLLQVDGPGKLLPAFRATNFGTMLASEGSSELKEILQQPFRQLLEGLSEQAGGRMSALLTELEDYRGRISLALDFTAHPQAWAGVRPNSSGVLVLAPDGSEDLAAIAGLVKESLSSSKLRTGSIDRGEQQLDCLYFDEDGQHGFTLPFMHEEHLLLAYSEDLAAYAASLFNEEGRVVETNAEFRASPVAMRIDIPQLLGLADDDASWQLVNLDAQKMFEVIGLASLQEMQLLLKPAGPRIMMESSILFGEGERGIFGALFSSQQGAPKLLEYVPESSRSWRAANLHSGQLLRTISRGLALGFNGDADKPGMLEDFEAETGVDILEELCARIDPSCLQLVDLPAYEDEDPTDDLPWNVVMLFRLREPAAFAEAWQKIMRDEGLGLDFGDPEEKFGTEVHSAGFFGPSDEFAYAIREDLLLLAIGDLARDRLLTALEQVSKPGRAKTGLDREFERLLRNQPPGYNGASQVDLLRYLEVLSDFGPLGLGGEVGADFDAVWEQMGSELIELLRGHGLDSLYAFMGYEENRFRHRLLW
jgi:hypothetical protein